ncbi:MAG: hypothetical protein ABSF22_17195 [Bryobacteraceae bacterium]|jgi:hypothetical protein
MKWRFFIAAALACAVVLLWAGAPPLPIALGVAGALAFNLYQRRKV